MASKIYTRQKEGAEGYMQRGKRKEKELEGTRGRMRKQEQVQTTQGGTNTRVKTKRIKNKIYTFLIWFWGHVLWISRTFNPNRFQKEFRADLV
jgi:hypothetical protein